MKYFIYFLAIITLLGINLGLFENLQIYGQIPNLLLLLSLFFVFEKQDYDFFFIVLLSGLFLDFFSTGFFGSFTLSFLLIFFAMHLFVNNLMVVDLNWRSASVSLFICFISLNFFIWAMGAVAFKFNWISSSANFKLFEDAFIPGLVYNWLLLYPVYLYASFVKRLVENLALRRRGVIR